MEYRKRLLRQTIYPLSSTPLDNSLYSHIGAFGSIRTKCLPCLSAEGGTSTAIRGNWRYLWSARERWHQFLLPWPQKCLLRDQTNSQRSWGRRALLKLTRGLPSPWCGDPAFLLGLYALGTRSRLAVSLSDFFCVVNVIVNQGGLGCCRGILWEGEERGQSYMLTWWIDHYKCSLNSISDDWWCFSFFSTE